MGLLTTVVLIFKDSFLRFIEEKETLKEDASLKPSRCNCCVTCSSVMEKRLCGSVVIHTLKVSCGASAVVTVSSSSSMNSRPRWQFCRRTQPPCRHSPHIISYPGTEKHPPSIKCHSPASLMSGSVSLHAPLVLVPLISLCSLWTQ